MADTSLFETAGRQVEGSIPPPPGVIPNFNSPKDELNTILIVTQALCISFVTIFLALRVYVRLRILRSFGKEDYTCVISWFLCVLYCICCLIMARTGAGHNQYEVTPETMTNFLKISYAATIVYMPMAFVVKLALLFIIARVFSPYRKSVIFIYVFIGLLLVYYTAGLIVKIRPCMPVSDYWYGNHSRCLDQQAIIMCDSIVSVVSDIMILLLPLPLTWSLQMETKKKLRVMGILAAGGLATGFSIYRLAMIVETGRSANQTMVFTRVVLSGNAEIGIGLICACLPALNALVERTRRQYSSKKNLSAARDTELSRMSRPMPAPRHPATHDREGSDKDYLIGYDQQPGGIETTIRGETTSNDSRKYSFDGIVKTVDVSHAYDDTPK